MRAKQRKFFEEEKPVWSKKEALEYARLCKKNYEQFTARWFYFEQLACAYAKGQTIQVNSSFSTGRRYWRDEPNPKEWITNNYTHPTALRVRPGK